jgi:hypothetical protein
MASFLDLAGLTYFKQQLFSKLALKDEVVLLTPQTLTAAQQVQALANIAALGLSGGTIKGALAVQGTMTVQTPTANANPATKQYVDEKVSASTGVPAGAIMFFGVMSIPDGWLLCNGANVSRTTYANLFAAIGTNFGSGNGSTTFTLPNLSGRFIEGATSPISVGKTFSAGVPNITGTFINGGDWGAEWQPPSGCFARTGVQNSGASGTDYRELTKIDASLSSATFGRSSTVQPPSMALLACIKT